MRHTSLIVPSEIKPDATSCHASINVETTTAWAFWGDEVSCRRVPSAVLKPKSGATDTSTFIKNLTDLVGFYMGSKAGTPLLRALEHRGAVLGHDCAIHDNRGSTKVREAFAYESIAEVFLVGEDREVQRGVRLRW